MKILIADDDRNLRKVLRSELSEEGFDIDEAESGGKARDLLEKEDYDVLVLDLTMPGIGGIEVLKWMKALEMSTEVIILTGNAAVPTAVEAMKLGAYDYLSKPFKMDELKVVIGKAFEKKKLFSENLVLKAQVKRQSKGEKLITKNPSMLKIFENLRNMAGSDVPVLICGESGVGKELIARSVHDFSHRGNGPFIPINCGAIPETMLESELFGYAKGAFTGAFAKKLGLLEIAHHGTLFLDEICELTLPLQGKLLRVIETGKFFKLGGVRETEVDVKFLSATNKDIQDEVGKGHFRSDLYFRISSVTLSIPPLRERREDILLLVKHQIEKNPAFKHRRFSEEALKILSGYPWPGNVRELQNVVHRTLLLSRNEVIEPCDLPADLNATSKASGKRLEDIEREHILKVLKEAGGQKGRAAELLGVDPKTLYRKLIRYGIHR